MTRFYRRHFNLVPFCLLIGCIGSLSACHADETITSIRMKVVQDSKVFTHVTRFRVSVFAVTSVQGSDVVCDDFPKTYTSIADKPKNASTENGESQAKDPNHPLMTLAQEALAWDGKTTEAQLNLVVPAKQKLVLVAEGLAETKVVARGCQVLDPLVEKSDQSLALDLIATTGKGCASDEECEAGATCVLNTISESGGYCAVIGCAIDESSCPPGSSCVSDGATQGICARNCQNAGDCDTISGQQCENRKGPTTCALVCAATKWNALEKCE